MMPREEFDNDQKKTKLWTDQNSFSGEISWVSHFWFLCLLQSSYLRLPMLYGTPGCSR